MIRILLSTRLGERRMTQTELARATGIRAQTINELYHDFAERISLDDLDLICEALDCSIDELIVRERGASSHGGAPDPENRKQGPKEVSCSPLPGYTIRAFYINIFVYFIIYFLDKISVSLLSFKAKRKIL